MPLLLLLLGGGALYLFSQRKRAEGAPTPPQLPPAPPPILPGSAVPVSAGQTWRLVMTIAPGIAPDWLQTWQHTFEATFRAGHVANHIRSFEVASRGGSTVVEAVITYGGPGVIQRGTFPVPARLSPDGIARMMTIEASPVAAVQGWFDPDPWRYFVAVNARTGRVYSRMGPRRMSDYQAEVETADLIQSGLKHGIMTKVVRFDYKQGAWRRA